MKTLLAPILTLSFCLACGPAPAPGGGSGGTGGAGSAGLPCDVATVLRDQCQTCHAATPLFGAPMSLTSYADTQAPARSDPSRPVWQLMKEQVEAGTMPQGSALTLAERAVLDAWFAAGAPGSSDACPDAGTPIDPNAGVGPEQLPCTPSHVLRAHAPGDRDAKYPVPAPADNAYVCFNFKNPFLNGQQATAWAPIIDDERIIHHWILYGTTQEVVDGSVGPCPFGGEVLTAQIAGWAPGGTNTVLDPDVGLYLDYPYLSLQVHYNNVAFADGADASGVAFCTTPTPRLHTAGIATLGNVTFTIPAGARNYPVVGNCSRLSTNGQPITVVDTWPHMHLLGSGLRTEHLRPGATLPSLSDIPVGTWQFEAQRHYPQRPRAEVRSGDVLRTTCWFDNTRPRAVGYGEETEDEMCFNFVLAYPHASLNKLCAL